jgi:hypothetical protein
MCFGDWCGITDFLVTGAAFAERFLTALGMTAGATVQAIEERQKENGYERI